MAVLLRSSAPLMAAAVVLAAGAAASASLIPTFRTVALTGTDGVYGPGLGAGVSFTLVDSTPPINNAGQVAFRGSTIAAAFAPEGVWMRPDATTTSSNLVLAREGMARPGGGTYAIGTGGYNTIQLNNAGMTAFRIGASTGVFASDGTTMKRVALAGDLAPSTGSATYSTSPIASGAPLFNQTGQTAFVGGLTTGTGTPPVVITSGINNSTAVFIGSGDNSGGVNPNASPVVRANDWFAGLGGTSADTKVSSFTQATMSLNGNGRYVVSATLQGSAIVTGTGATSNSAAILSNRTGSNDVIARVGNAAPDSTGAASADVYRSFGGSGIGFNDLGHTAFTAALRQGATQTVASAIFTDTNGGITGGTMKRIASAGGAIGNVYALNDNTTPLAEFASLTYGASATFATTLLNRRDDLLFSANMSSGGQAFLLRDAAGDLHRVVRVGDNPLGGPDPLSTGGTGNSTFSGISNTALNALGQVAFTGNLTGPGVSVGLGNGSTLWATDLDGSLVLIARTGTPFTDGLGNVHTISSINVAGNTGNQDGRVSGFNDLGDLSFTLAFSDGTQGAFVTHIPAPGAASLLAVGGLLTARRRRR